MKCKFTLLLVFLFSLVGISSQSQISVSSVEGGEFQFNANRTPCLTDAQRAEVLTEIKANVLQLKANKKLNYDTAQKRASHPLFSWPVKMKAGLPYNDVWAISNYVDQNPAYPNEVKDYNCGTKTYDSNAGYNHMGVDIFTWPFSWKMMDDEEAEIIAAAPGQIISIIRNQYDRSCQLNNNLWNAVYVQHADGSVAIYGHMKKNSPTPKIVGDMVAKGEYLGIIGSSGNSSGPHLHFEVYSEIEWQGVGQDVLVDPYAGPCNLMNSDTWWENQKPYVDPNINAVLTHSASPQFPNCPGKEITHEKDVFAPGDDAYFAIYLRDQVAGTNIELTILKPNGTVYATWDYRLVDNYTASYWYWYYEMPNIVGKWTWRATYNGQEVSHNFTVGTLSTEETNFESVSIYPNPFNAVINIKSTVPVQKVTVVNSVGKTIMTTNTVSSGIKEVNLESLSNGLYFLTLEGDANQKKIIKLIKE